MKNYIQSLYIYCIQTVYRKSLLLWKSENFHKSMALISAIVGVTLGIWSIYLTFEIKNQQQLTDKKSLEAAVIKITFFSNEPKGGLPEFKNLSYEQVVPILKETLFAVESQMNNQYLISLPACSKEWYSFRDYLALLINDKSVFDIMNSEGHTIAESYYIRRNSITQDCMSWGKVGEKPSVPR